MRCRCADPPPPLSEIVESGSAFNALQHDIRQKAALTNMKQGDVCIKVLQKATAIQL